MLFVLPSLLMIVQVLQIFMHKMELLLTKTLPDRVGKKKGNGRAQRLGEGEEEEKEKEKDRKREGKRKKRKKKREREIIERKKERAHERMEDGEEVNE